jgi:hypothetical protein
VRPRLGSGSMYTPPLAEFMSSGDCQARFACRSVSVRGAGQLEPLTLLLTRTCVPVSAAPKAARLAAGSIATSSRW